jgi:hypothetical protein
MKTHPHAVDLKHITHEDFQRLSMLESGWESFREELVKHSFDDPDRRARDAFFAGASFIVTALTVLADPKHDLMRYEICDKLDQEVREFNESGGYDPSFRPFLP